MRYKTSGMVIALIATMALVLMPRAGSAATYNIPTIKRGYATDTGWEYLSSDMNVGYKDNPVANNVSYRAFAWFDIPSEVQSGTISSAYISVQVKDISQWNSKLDYIEVFDMGSRSWAQFYDDNFGYGWQDGHWTWLEGTNAQDNSSKTVSGVLTFDISASYLANKGEAGFTFRANPEDPSGTIWDDTHTIILNDPILHITYSSPDTTAPDTTITSYPSNPSTSSSASFNFTSTETGSTFECKLNGGPWLSCASPKSYSGLTTDRSHTFKVRATDGSGNTDTTPASHTWVIDATPPTISISSPCSTSCETDSSSITVSGSVSDSGGSGLDKVRVYNLTNGSNAWDYSVSGGSFSVPGISLSVGSNSIKAIAWDVVGNPMSHIVYVTYPTVDRSPPDTTISSAPSNPSNSSSASFSFTSTEAGSTFQCQLDGSSWISCASPKGYSGLANTSHTFRVRATDGANNTDPTPASYSWTIETTMIDTIPDPFTFTDQTGVALNTIVTSNTIMVMGINAASPISITGGTYSINGAPYTSASGTVNNGNTVTIRVTSSGSYLTPRHARLTTGGGVSDTFSVTTQSAPSDTAPPTTTAVPPGGTYTSTQSITLACDDGSGSGCDKTYYCLGVDCTIWIEYSGMPISVANSTDLRFYSTDLASNSEAVKIGTYVIESSNVQVYNSTDIPKSITDHTTLTSILTVAETELISDVDVGITLTHSYDSDLDIFLISPSGARVELSTDNGGSGNNYTDTVFDDGATGPITSGTAPFTGSFKPEGLLSAFNGFSANGIWTLEISDDASVDTGALAGWYVKITTVPYPDGLSTHPDDTGIVGIKRADGGDDSNNLDTASGKPRVDKEYTFEMVLRDSSGNAPEYVRVYITQRSNPLASDFHSYDLTCTGDISSGATCSYTTKLGPAPVHKYYFEAKLSDGSIVRMPESGEYTGPIVELLTGYNIVGIPRDITSAYLDGNAAFGSIRTYRWTSEGLTRAPGQYDQVLSANPVRPGEGYFTWKESGVTTIPEFDSYNDISEATYAITLRPGWNMISNPYKGNVKLTEVKVQKGTDTPISWSESTTNDWLTNAIYYYQGRDWGRTYSFESAGGSPDATLTPWLGYWIFLKNTDDTYQLIISKP